MAGRASNLGDVAAQFAATILGRGCYLLLSILLARSMDPTDFGFYAIGWTVTGLIATFAPVGMPQAMLRFGVAGRRALRGAPIAIVVGTGLALMTLLILTAEPVANYLFDSPRAAWAIVGLAPSIPLIGILGLLQSALRASGGNVASAAIGALIFALYLAATALAFLFDLAPTPMTVGLLYSLALGLSLLPVVYLLYRLPPQDHLKGLSALLQFGLVTMVISSANILNLWADRLVIGMMADARAVGLYQVASQLAVVAVVIRSAVITVFEARVPKLARSCGAPPDVTRDYLASARLLLHASAPGLVCLALTAPFWTATLFGPHYAAAALPLSVLVLGQLALSFAGPAVNALQMTGAERLAMIVTIVTCLLNILGNVLLIPPFGLVGSAIATGLANLAVGGLSLWWLRRSGRLGPYLPRIANILLATLVSLGAVLLTTHWLHDHSLLGVLTSLVAAYGSYALILLLTCREEDEALALLRRLLQRGPLRRLPAP